MSVKYLKECVLGIFFLSFLCLGLSIFDDYGVSVDEARNRKNALTNYNILSVHQYPSPLQSWDKYHGSAFDLALYLVEKIIRIHPEDHRTQFLYRHLINFLVFFLSVLAFYKLLNGRFNHWGLALLGCCFLILSPRIFADSFYNSKDLAFLSFFILSIATQQWYVAKPRLKSLIAHAFFCGICVDIRISGILSPLLTVFLLIAAMIHCPDAAASRYKRYHLVLFMFLTFVFIVSFWPMLWRNPAGELINAVKFMTQLPNDVPVLFLGKAYSSLHLPWNYVPLWIAITTPPLYLFLFVVGSAVLISRLIREPWIMLRNNPQDLVGLLWFFGPLLLAIVANVNLYDGYRHLYFIDPA
jgi:hypothetical protein